MKPYIRTNRPTLGRTPRREGASTQGHLSTWTRSIVSQQLAEMEKRRIGDRAADLYTNDAMGHGLLESLIVEAVGIGLTPQFSPDHEALGMSQAWSDEFSAGLSRLWGRFGLDARKFCDAQRRLGIYGLQQLMYFAWKLTGIGLAQIVRRDDAIAPTPLCVLPIDPARLVTPSDRPSNRIYDGVEIDDFGAPVNVWLARPETMSPFKTSYRAEECRSWPVRDAKTGLPRMLLVTGVRNVAEYQQDSILAPMIDDMRNNRDFVSAALVRAMMSNLFFMFLENSAAKPAGDDLASRIVELDKGTILQGARTEKPHFFNLDNAPDGYRVMFDSIVDRLGMATARGAENVIRKYQASYSASKASMVKAAQVNSTDHMVLNDNFNQVLLMWLIYERAVSGALPVPSMATLPQDLYELSLCRWLPQPMPEIDRQKRATAIKTELETHQITYSDVCGERGQDWRKHMRQKAIELSYIKGLEAEFGISMAVPDAQQPEAQEPDDQDGTDKETEDE
jgi:capsid protein